MVRDEKAKLRSFCFLAFALIFIGPLITDDNTPSTFSLFMYGISFPPLAVFLYYTFLNYRNSLKSIGEEYLSPCNHGYPFKLALRGIGANNQGLKYIFPIAPALQFIAYSQDLEINLPSLEIFYSQDVTISSIGIFAYACFRLLFHFTVFISLVLFSLFLFNFERKRGQKLDDRYVVPIHPETGKITKDSLKDFLVPKTSRKGRGRVRTYWQPNLELYLQNIGKLLQSSPKGDVLTAQERQLFSLLTYYLYQHIRYATGHAKDGEFWDFGETPWEWGCDFISDVGIFTSNGSSNVYKMAIKDEDIVPHILNREGISRRDLYDALTCFVELTTDYSSPFSTPCLPSDLTEFTPPIPLKDIFIRLDQLSYVKKKNGTYQWAEKTYSCLDWTHIDLVSKTIIKKWAKHQIAAMPDTLPERIQTLYDNDKGKHLPSLIWRHWDGVQWQAVVEDETQELGRYFRNEILMMELIKQLNLKDYPPSSATLGREAASQ